MKTYKPKHIRFFNRFYFGAWGLLLAICFLVSSPVLAASSPQKIGQHGDWGTYTYTENGKKVCFMASSPIKSVGNYKRRGEVFALITHRPGENTTDVVSFIAGYTYRTDSEVTVKADGKTFTLFTQSDTAWAPDADTDHRITEAIRKGSNMVIEGVSSRGTKTTDTYSLKGSSAAYREISKSCNVK